jgi:predicted enzyme related to lactoylglutathione lyase
MRKLILPLAFLATFCLGFTAAKFIEDNPTVPPGHVTSIGGIFFKAENPDSLKKWYTKNLGMPVDKYGTVFVWYHGADSTKHGYTQWSVFKNTTKYFQPSQKEFMINYRVDNLDLMMKRFKENGVTICDTVETYDYGKFVHIMDPDGNKIELWEPYDDNYGKISGATVK